ncbi:MAG: putative aromatic compound monooxygenase YhjG [Microvirga sp.]|nr:putative aromatic compound monooxygenase YhjG [Microvirga sp.]
MVKGISAESLLDTYHAERHPVGARVLRNTMASVVLRREDERTKALRDIMAELLSMDEPRRRFAAMMSGLDIHYDLGAGHPLLGRRMPDLDLVTADGTARVFTSGPTVMSPGPETKPRRASPTRSLPGSIRCCGVAHRPRLLLRVETCRRRTLINVSHIITDVVPGLRS